MPPLMISHLWGCSEDKSHKEQGTLSEKHTLVA
jgi:hypothetical protein